MRRAIRMTVLAGIFAVTSMVMGSPAAEAQGFGHGHHHGYSGGYGVPAYRYYGNGGHDLQPHMHTRQTPFGASSYYGGGRHDLRPHGHVETPYGITGYRNGLFGSTQSFSPPAPYGYRPW